MRNLKYVSLLLAAGMFAACSDNLDVNKENGAGGGDKTPAYLTISIANNGNSSRANTGTDDGTAEDSGLGNAGTANENKVNTICLSHFRRMNQAVSPNSMLLEQGVMSPNGQILLAPIRPMRPLSCL